MNMKELNVMNSLSYKSVVYDVINVLWRLKCLLLKPMLILAIKEGIYRQLINIKSFKKYMIMNEANVMNSLSYKSLLYSVISKELYQFRCGVGSEVSPIKTHVNFSI